MLRAAERDAQRRHKAALKAQTIQDAAAAVDTWEAYVHGLTSVHTDLADSINWHRIAALPEPTAPQFSNTHQQKAKAALVAFKPTIFDIFRGGSEKRRSLLEADLAVAGKRDQADYENAMRDYRRELQEWEADTSLARQLLAGESSAIKTVITEMQSLTNEDLIGSAVTFAIGENFLHAKPEVHSDEIVPNFRRKQLASGRLSESKMPVGQFNELYQDYVGSVALKTAGDLFNIVPLDEIYVTCLARMLNSKTGHQELMPILSAQFVRSTFARLSLENLDPSDSMANFNHVMSFKKSKGFAPITPLKSID
ncbi:MAG: hypothetical protein ACFB13_04000 [Kiloniellaceae bacterium]